MIRQSKKPVILGGRGAYLAGAKPGLVELSDRIGALLTTSLLARDWFADNPFSVGVSGGFSTSEGAEILNDADLVIAFGATLNNATLRHGSLYPQAKFVQIDIDPMVFNDINHVDKVILGDAKATAQALLMAISQKIDLPGWRDATMANRIKAIDRWKDRDLTERPGKANPRLVVDACDKLLPKQRIILTDIGLYMGVPAAYMTVTSPGDIVFPWHLGRVGCGLPVALGAAVGRRDRLVTAFLGDGGMMAAMHALDTVRSANVPIVIIVMDDGGFGAERRIFNRHHENPKTANYVTPDLASVAKSLGIEGHRATSGAEVRRILTGRDFTKGALLIHVIMDGDTEPVEMEFSGWA